MRGAISAGRRKKIGFVGSATVWFPAYLQVAAKGNTLSSKILSPRCPHHHRTRRIDLLLSTLLLLSAPSAVRTATIRPASYLPANEEARMQISFFYNLAKTRSEDACYLPVITEVEKHSSDPAWWQPPSRSPLTTIRSQRGTTSSLTMMMAYMPAAATYILAVGACSRD